MTAAARWNAQSSSVQTRGYSYDWLGRLTSEMNPESAMTATTYAYDTVPSNCYNYGDNQSGNLTGKTDANGNTNCFHYDPLHRLLDVGSTGSNNSNYCKRFRYDATGNGVTSVPTGANIANVAARLVEAETDGCASPPNTTTDEWFSYDADGNTTNLWEHTPNSGSGYYYPIAASYWPNGLIYQISGVPGLPTITYGGANGCAPNCPGLDSEGRVTQVTASSGQNPVSAVTYNPAQQLTGITYGSGDSDSYTYYSTTGRMQTYSFDVGGQTETGTLTWNGTATLGQLAITDPFNSGDNQTCAYTYDNLMRIATANCGSVWTQTFSYDAFGNLTATGTGNFQPSYSTSNTNRISQLGSTNAVYDADGHVLNDTMHTFAWDVYGLPSSIDGITMTYDALGRMVERNNAGTITQVVYTPSGAKLGIMSGQSLGAGYVPLPNGTVAHYYGNGNYLYRHPDWQGSARLVSTSTSGTYDDSAFSPFGYPYIGSYDSFTDMNVDTSSGLYDFPAREYEWQGRWPSPDPAGMAAVDPTNPQSWNRYAYVGNNPLAYVDPSGMHLCAPNNSAPANSPSCFHGTGGLQLPQGDYPVNAGTGISIGPLNYVSFSTTTWVPDPSSYFLGFMTEAPTDFFAASGTYVVDVSLVTLNMPGGPITTPSYGGGGSTAWLQTKVFVQAVARNFANEFKPNGCFVQFLNEAFNPFDSVSGQDQAIKSVAQSGAYSTALVYAANKGLVVPMRSSVVRGILGLGEAAGEFFALAPTVYEEGKALVNEVQSLNNGECQ